MVILGHIFLQSDEELHIFPIEEPWTVQEENMLLDAVEQFGFGNWWVLYQCEIVFLLLKTKINN